MTIKWKRYLYLIESFRVDLKAVSKSYQEKVIGILVVILLI